MKPRDKSVSLWQSLWRPMVLGLCVGVVCCTLWLLLAAALVNTIDVPQEVIAPLAVCAAGLGAFAAGLTAGLVTGRRGLMWGAICGASLYLILLCSGLIRAGGVDGGYALIKWAVLTLCGAVGGLLAVNRKR